MNDQHWAVKLIVVIAVLYLGLDLMGRWTGHYLGELSFTGLNPIGQTINASRSKLGQAPA